jgi:putative inorganic carbon (hco3(-)) transporter
MITSDEYLSIGVGAMWAQFKREPLYFWLFCGYIFFEYVRPQSIYPSIDILPWTKLCVIGALIGTLRSRESSPPATPLAKYYWGLIVVVFFSALFAEFPGYAFSKFAEAFNWLIIFYLFIRIVTNRYRFFVVLLLMVLASYKMSQHGAITWALRGFAFEEWGIAGPGGYFGNAADLGVQMLIMLPISFAFFMGCHSYWGKLKKLFFIIFPVTVLMSIVATGERGTILGLAAIGLVFVLASKKRIRNLFLISILTALVFAAMPQEHLDRFSTAGEDETSLARIRYWKRGVEIFKDHPVLGIGFYNWIPYYAKHYPYESLRASHQEIAHSTPIIVLAELGVFGFIFYYGLALKVIVLNFRSMKMARFDEETIWGRIPFALILGIVGYSVASIFITVTFYPFLFIQASLSAALYNILSKENRFMPDGDPEAEKIRA